MAGRKAVLKWLLDSDPAIRWQVLRDLTDGPTEVIEAERSRVVAEGWGAKLLGLQSPHGDWGDDQNHGWMTTTDALTLLRGFGVDAHSPQVRMAIDRLRKGVVWWQLSGQPFFDGETEACINGRILAAGAYFDAASETLLARLLNEQLEDGGWNCEAPPSTRSSFHSTICVLEGLLQYEKANGETPEVTQARLRGQDYLLQRHLLQSLATGEVIDARWTRFAYPPVWRYDILRGLDYLRNAGVVPDERMTEAVGMVEKRRHQNGRWPLGTISPDQARLPFPMEAGRGKASRWNTLRALRVLDWFGRVPAQSG